jgi:hypothetical protein
MPDFLIYEELNDLAYRTYAQTRRNSVGIGEHAQISPRLVSRVSVFLEPTSDSELKQASPHSQRAQRTKI